MREEWHPWNMYVLNSFFKIEKRDDLPCLAPSVTTPVANW